MNQPADEEVGAGQAGQAGRAVVGLGRVAREAQGQGRGRDRADGRAGDRRGDRIVAGGRAGQGHALQIHRDAGRDIDAVEGAVVRAVPGDRAGVDLHIGRVGAEHAGQGIGAGAQAGDAAGPVIDLGHARQADELGGDRAGPAQRGGHDVVVVAEAGRAGVDIVGRRQGRRTGARAHLHRGRVGVDGGAAGVEIDAAGARHLGALAVDEAVQHIGRRRQAQGRAGPVVGLALAVDAAGDGHRGDRGRARGRAAQAVVGLELGDLAGGHRAEAEVAPADARRRDADGARLMAGDVDVLAVEGRIDEQVGRAAVDPDAEAGVRRDDPGDRIVARGQDAGAAHHHAGRAVIGLGRGVDDVQGQGGRGDEADRGVRRRQLHGVVEGVGPAQGHGQDVDPDAGAHILRIVGAGGAGDIDHVAADDPAQHIARAGRRQAGGPVVDLGDAAQADRQGRRRDRAGA